MEAVFLSLCFLVYKTEEPSATLQGYQRKFCFWRKLQLTNITVTKGWKAYSAAEMGLAVLCYIKKDITNTNANICKYCVPNIKHIRQMDSLPITTTCH